MDYFEKDRQNEAVSLLKKTFKSIGKKAIKPMTDEDIEKLVRSSSVPLISASNTIIEIIDKKERNEANSAEHYSDEKLAEWIKKYEEMPDDKVKEYTHKDYLNEKRYWGFAVARSKRAEENLARINSVIDTIETDKPVTAETRDSLKKLFGTAVMRSINRSSEEAQEKLESLREVTPNEWREKKIADIKDFFRVQRKKKNILTKDTWMYNI